MKGQPKVVLDLCQLLRSLVQGLMGQVLQLIVGQVFYVGGQYEYRQAGSSPGLGYGRSQPAKLLGDYDD